MTCANRGTKDEGERQKEGEKKRVKYSIPSVPFYFYTPHSLALLKLPYTTRKSMLNLTTGV